MPNFKLICVKKGASGNNSVLGPCPVVYYETIFDKNMCWYNCRVIKVYIDYIYNHFFITKMINLWFCEKTLQNKFIYI